MFQDDPLGQTYDAIVVGRAPPADGPRNVFPKPDSPSRCWKPGRNISPKNSPSTCRRINCGTGTYRSRSAQARPIQKQCYACMEYNYDWFVNDLRIRTARPGQAVHVAAAAIVGGRTLVWGRQSYRLSDLDFKAASHDGYGRTGRSLTRTLRRITTWSRITSESAERRKGIRRSGRSFFSADEDDLRRSAYERPRQKQFGRTVTIGRTAILTKNHNGRAGMSLLRAM